MKALALKYVSITAFICFIGFTPYQPASAMVDATAERIKEHSYRLSWQLQGLVAIYVSPQPNEGVKTMQLLKEGVTVNEITVTVPDDIARPYFVIKAPNSEPVRVAERVLPLQGGRNFRDLGGYKTTEGKTVAWG